MKYHYTSLRVFETADQLAHLIFIITAMFPKDELYVTTSQLKRAVLSVVLNIVEGSSKRLASNKEFERFLKISFGSLQEVEYLLRFSLKRGFLNQRNFDEIEELKNKCSAQLWKLIHATK